MPEGDTLFRLAALLAPALEGELVQRAELPRAGGGDRLVGQRITSVRALGKNLLMTFERGDVLHAHLKMTGSWHLYRPGESWRLSARAAVVIIEVPNQTAVCFAAPIVRLLARFQARDDAQLRRLGPDLLAEVPDVTQAVERLQQRAATSLGEVLLEQSVMAGIGNVFKSELLFNLRLNPFAAVDSLSAEQLRAMVEHGIELLRQNTGTGLRYTRTTRPGPGPALSVYGRAGQPCLDCSTTIEMQRQGEQQRSTYFCPRCQLPLEWSHR